MDKALKMTGGVVLILVGLAIAVYGVMEFLNAPAGTPGRPGYIFVLAGAFGVLLGGGLIGNALGKIKM